MQAIITKYLGPTNHRPGRVKAQCEAGCLTVEWDHALGIAENHAATAEALRTKLGWTGPHYGRLVSGTLPDGRDCHVMTRT